MSRRPRSKRTITSPMHITVVVDDLQFVMHLEPFRVYDYALIQNIRTGDTFKMTPPQLIRVLKDVAERQNVS